MDLINILWLFIILASLQPALQRRLLELSRKRALARLASERGSTVVTLIHRQETMSFLGFPLVRYITSTPPRECWAPSGPPVPAHQ
jgi:ClpP class serine protease